jgi:hypothetical protein
LLGTAAGEAMLAASADGGLIAYDPQYEGDFQSRHEQAAE